MANSYRFALSSGLITITAFVISVLSSWAVTIGQTAFAAPVLPPTIEVAYQSALASVPMPALSDEGLKLLDGIAIRSRLEDTARLHYDLG